MKEIIYYRPLGPNEPPDEKNDTLIAEEDGAHWFCKIPALQIPEVEGLNLIRNLSARIEQLREAKQKLENFAIATETWAKANHQDELARLARDYINKANDLDGRCGN